MEIELNTGRLQQAKYIESPNYNQRPQGEEINLLVIHCISLPPGIFSGEAIDRLFTNTLDHKADPYYHTLLGLKVSAHLLIRRDGLLTQYVPFHLRAWHAGVSQWQGQENCNDFSIGIELEGTEETTYTAEQYRVLIQVTECLLNSYSAITPERIVGHSDISPGRKLDPGPGFDWSRYRQALSQKYQQY